MIAACLLMLINLVAMLFLAIEVWHAYQEICTILWSIKDSSVAKDSIIVELEARNDLLKQMVEQLGRK